MSIPLAIGQIGTWQFVLLLLVVLLLFGAKRLPNMARSLGRSLTEFRKGLKGEDGGDADEEDLKKLRPDDAEGAPSEVEKDRSG